LGYDGLSAAICTELTCLNGFLAQGAPTSPTLSNICFREIDDALITIATQLSCQVTRYADDIVFSGSGTQPENLPQMLAELFGPSPWALAPQKTLVQPLKGRIKVHGLVVGHDAVRLTKGYRNKIRAYGYILATKGEGAFESAKLRGHVQYARQIQELTGAATGMAPGVEERLKIGQRSHGPTSDLAGSFLRRLRRFLGLKTAEQRNPAAKL
jgi:RNA-directed DNA polymerase